MFRMRESVWKPEQTTKQQVARLKLVINVNQGNVAGVCMQCLRQLTGFFKQNFCTNDFFDWVVENSTRTGCCIFS